MREKDSLQLNLFCLEGTMSGWEAGLCVKNDCVIQYLVEVNKTPGPWSRGVQWVTRGLVSSVTDFQRPLPSLASPGQVFVKRWKAALIRYAFLIPFICISWRVFFQLASPLIPTLFCLTPSELIRLMQLSIIPTQNRTELTHKYIEEAHWKCSEYILPTAQQHPKGFSQRSSLSYTPSTPNLFLSAITVSSVRQNKWIRGHKVSHQVIHLIRT